MVDIERGKRGPARHLSDGIWYWVRTMHRVSAGSNSINETNLEDDRHVWEIGPMEAGVQRLLD